MAKLRAIHCPSCGSSEVESLETRGIREIALALLGTYAFHCNHCSQEFLARPLGLASLFHAKCPRCYRMDLTIWDPKRYRSRSWERFKLNLGANAWRCEPCRCNFVSFRPRKEKYVRPGRQENEESGDSAAPDSSQMQDV
jgi:hypothetical protein